MQVNHYREGVNVKVHSAPEIDGMRELGDERLERIWTQLQESFWYELAEQVREAGLGRDVYSYGRMGGWAVLDPSPDPEDEPERAARFEDLVRALLADYLAELWPERVADELAELQAQRERNIVRGAD